MKSELILYGLAIAWFILLFTNIGQTIMMYAFFLTIAIIASQIIFYFFKKR